MEQLILIIHVAVAVTLIALILVQHGQGADIGAAFGSGASNTMFGSVGSTPFLVKVSALLALTFFCTSLTLSYIASHRPKAASIINMQTQQPRLIQPANSPVEKTNKHHSRVSSPRSSRGALPVKSH